MFTSRLSGRAGPPSWYTRWELAITWKMDTIASRSGAPWGWHSSRRRYGNIRPWQMNQNSANLSPARNGDLQRYTPVSQSSPVWPTQKAQSIDNSELFDSWLSQGKSEGNRGYLRVRRMTTRLRTGIRWAAGFEMKSAENSLTTAPISLSIKLNISSPF